MKIFSKGLILTIGIILIASCASGPTYDELKSTIPDLSPDSGRIYIYRVAMQGYLVQPDVMLNGEKIGEVRAQGFFYVDRPAGNYDIMISDEADRKLSFTLENNQIKYVSIGLASGLFEGHFYPKLVEEQEGLEGLKFCKYSQSD